MSATGETTTRTRTMLLARVRGRRDALTEEWGERPERPPQPAARDVAERPAPADAAAFDERAYQWRVDVVLTDDAGRVLLHRDGDSWTLPGGAGERAETLDAAAIRHAAPTAGDDLALRDLLWTQVSSSTTTPSPTRRSAPSFTSKSPTASARRASGSPPRTCPRRYPIARRSASPSRSARRTRTSSGGPSLPPSRSRPVRDRARPRSAR
ncbi:NUDIX hydrolase [Halarchaeum acidiphilum]|uniref:NUDIX hydrolase n=1 Tax=Halarchaeum acidiphilum TaxID=489138 RepID=UPI0019020E7F